MVCSNIVIVNLIRSMDNKLFEACNWINNSQILLIGAGAGMSADSGLDLFRTPADFWKFYPQLEHLNYYVPEMSNYNIFIKNPHLAWGYYSYRFQLYDKTLPHSGFEYLRKICQLNEKKYFIYTTNIDDHFKKAGFDEQKIYEPNGNINYLQYLNEKDGDDVWLFNPQDVPEFDKSTLLASKPFPEGPRMEEVRPNIIFYEENNFSTKRVSDQKKKFDIFINDIRVQEKISILEIGASGSLNGRKKPVRCITDEISQKFQGHSRIIRVNIDEHIVPSDHFGFSMNAQKALKEIYYTLKMLNIKNTVYDA